MKSAIHLSQMPALADLFRLFISGKHLNRISDSALWVELEQQQSLYMELFAALGYDLRLDGRGFAWFHTPDAASSAINKTSQQLAFLFMVIFDFQANAGKPLQRFMDWRLDRDVLSEVYAQHHELLTAEGMNFDAMIDLISNRACTLGFMQQESHTWSFLPSVYRYLDHFEALAVLTNAVEPALSSDFQENT